MKPRILIIDDEEAIRSSLQMIFEYEGYECLLAQNGAAGLKIADKEEPDLVFLDIKMPQMDGLEVLKKLRGDGGKAEVVILSGHGSVKTAVEATKAGAFDFIEKPPERERILLVARNALGQKQLRDENRRLKLSFDERYRVVGDSPALQRVLDAVRRAAPTSATVLITGESGSGKELVARAIHAASGRAGGPFVAVNGASLSPTLLESELFGHERGAFTGAERTRKGRFELASGGTFFLDEVGDLPPEVQVKLLRVLQEGTIERVGSAEPIRVDVRGVAATHRDLPAEVAAGRFREDLYYRLAVVALEIPPLRRRRADIPLLAEHFLAKHAANGARKQLSREAMDLLISYDFPGNVRQLENIVQRSLVLARGELITSADLPPTVTAGNIAGSKGRPAADSRWVDPGEGAPLPQRVEALERAAIEKALALEDGHQTRAAARLGISERALRYKMRKLGLRCAREEEGDGRAL